MRERVEDLGRLSEKLLDLMDRDIFRLIRGESYDMFIERNSDRDSMELLHAQISRVKDEIGLCYDIARWGDDEL